MAKGTQLPSAMADVDPDITLDADKSADLAAIIGRDLPKEVLRSFEESLNSFARAQRIEMAWATWEQVAEFLPEFRRAAQDVWSFTGRDLKGHPAARAQFLHLLERSMEPVPMSPQRGDVLTWRKRKWARADQTIFPTDVTMGFALNSTTLSIIARSLERAVALVEMEIQDRIDAPKPLSARVPAIDDFILRMRDVSKLHRLKILSPYDEAKAPGKLPQLISKLLGYCPSEIIEPIFHKDGGPTPGAIAARMVRAVNALVEHKRQQKLSSLAG